MSNNDPDLYQAKSFVARAPNRKKVMDCLNSEYNLNESSGDVYTPTDLAEELDTHIQTISRALVELVERELVNCLTPDAKKYRYYEITEKGRDVMELLD